MARAKPALERRPFRRQAAPSDRDGQPWRAVTAAPACRPAHAPGFTARYSLTIPPNTRRSTPVKPL